jgi:WD40 repeat protein
VRIWNANILRILHILTGHGERILRVGISKDDRYVFSGSDADLTVRVWEISNGVQLCCWKNLEEGEDWLANYPEMRVLVERFIS